MQPVSVCAPHAGADGSWVNMLQHGRAGSTQSAVADPTRPHPFHTDIKVGSAVVLCDAGDTEPSTLPCRCSEVSWRNRHRQCSNNFSGSGACSQKMQPVACTAVQQLCSSQYLAIPPPNLSSPWHDPIRVIFTTQVAFGMLRVRKFSQSVGCLRSVRSPVKSRATHASVVPSMSDFAAAKGTHPLPCNQPSDAWLRSLPRGGRALWLEMS